MQTDNPNSETLDNNNISKMSFSSHKEKKKKRNKVFWSEREEKTLFILQMALGTKFSIIKTFLKDKSVNDIKNHFYSKLRTYLSIQLAKLNSENFFKNIDKKNYTIKGVLSLVLSHKIPTMILNKNVIKELILNDEQQRKKKAKNKNREDDDLNLNKNKKKKQDVKLKRKRGRPKGVKNKKEEDKVIDEPANEKIGDDKDLELIESIFDIKGENNINSIMKENLDLKEKYNEVGKQNYDEVNEK
jgi:hypothetical protein